MPWAPHIDPAAQLRRGTAASGHVEVGASRHCSNQICRTFGYLRYLRYLHSIHLDWFPNKIKEMLWCYIYLYILLLYIYIYVHTYSVSYRHKCFFIRAFLNYLYSNVARAKLVCPSQSGSCWLLGDHKEVAHGVRWVARHSNGPSSNAGVISNSQQEHSWCSPSGKPPEVALYRPVLWQNFAICGRFCWEIAGIKGSDAGSSPICYEYVNID